MSSYAIIDIEQNIVVRVGSCRAELIPRQAREGERAVALSYPVSNPSQCTVEADGSVTVAALQPAAPGRGE